MKLKFVLRFSRYNYTVCIQGSFDQVANHYLGYTSSFLAKQWQDPCNSWKYSVPQMSQMEKTETKCRLTECPASKNWIALLWFLGGWVQLPVPHWSADTVVVAWPVCQAMLLWPMSRPAKCLWILWLFRSWYPTPLCRFWWEIGNLVISTRSFGRSFQSRICQAKPVY